MGKRKFLTDIELNENSRSKYVLNKDKYINKEYNFLYLKDIVCDTSGRVYGVCDCTRCGQKDVVTVISNLLSYRTVTCGCSREVSINNKYGKDSYIGQEVNGMIIEKIDRASDNEESSVYWEGRCKYCNKHMRKKASLQVKGTSRSCGCLLQKRNNKYSGDEWVGKEIFGTKVIKILESDASGQHWLCQCKYCGKQFKAVARKIVSRHTNSCGCNTESIGIKEIRNYLDSHGIKYKREWSSNDLISQYKHNLRIDVAILNNKDEVLAFIEYDGTQHYSMEDGFGNMEDREANFYDIIDSDMRKEAYAEKHNIPLLRIEYNRHSEEIINELESFINKLNIK